MDTPSLNISIKALNLPLDLKKFFKISDINKIIFFMKKDKKNISEKINLILIKKIGKIIKSNSFPIKANEIRKFLINSYF